MLPTSLGQVGVVGQAAEQGGHHGAGVHLLLQGKGASCQEAGGPGEGRRELDGHGQRVGTRKAKPLTMGKKARRWERKRNRWGNGKERTVG